MSLSSTALLVLVTARAVSYGITDVTYTDTYPTCVNQPSRIGVTSFAVAHPRAPGGVEPGRIALAIADAALADCHAAGEARTVATTFRLDTTSVVAGTDLLHLRFASDYVLHVNGVAVGRVRVGLVGDQEVEIFPPFAGESGGDR